MSDSSEPLCVKTGRFTYDQPCMQQDGADGDLIEDT